MVSADLARGGNRDGLAGFFSVYGEGHAVTPGPKPRGVPGLDVPHGLAGNERDLGGCGARAGTLRTAGIGFAGPEVDRPGTGGLLRYNQVPFGVGHGLPGVGGAVGENGAAGGDLGGLAGGRSHHEGHSVAPGTRPRGVPAQHMPHRLSGSERGFRSHFAGAGAGAATRIGLARPEVDRPRPGAVARGKQVPFGVAHGLPDIGRLVAGNGTVGGQLNGLGGEGPGHGKGHALAQGTKTRIVPGLDVPDGISGNERHVRSDRAGPGAAAAAGLVLAEPEVDRPGPRGVTRRKEVVGGVGHGLPGIGGLTGLNGAGRGDRGGIEERDGNVAGKRPIV